METIPRSYGRGEHGRNDFRADPVPAVAQRYEIDINGAFEMLRSYARRNHQRLLDVATAVVTDVVDYPDLVDS